MTLLISCVLLFHGTTVDAAEIVAAYQFPQNVCKVLVRNSATEALDLTAANMHVQPCPQPAVWTMAEPDVLQPGETSWVTALFPQSIPSEGRIPARIDAGGLQMAFSVAAQPRLVVTYCVRAVDEETAYVFVLNQTSSDCTLDAVDIDGAPVVLKNPVEIPAGKKRLLYGNWRMGSLNEFEVPQVVVRLTPVNEEPVQVGARLFKTSHTVIRAGGNTRATIECLSHSHGSPLAAASAAIAAAAEKRRTLRTIKFCNHDILANAADTFAQIVERNHIEPQLAYSDKCASSEYAHTLLECVERTRRATQPGITFAWVFPSDIHDVTSPPYGITRLRAMIYAMLAGGAKGLELFPPRFDDPNGRYAQANNRLLEDIALLQPLIAVSEAVDLLESKEPENFFIRTLLCGDKGILLFVLPYNDRTEGQANVDLLIPSPGYRLREEGYEVTTGAPLAVSPKGSQHYIIDCPLPGQAQLYLILAC